MRKHDPAAVTVGWLVGLTMAGAFTLVALLTMFMTREECYYTDRQGVIWHQEIAGPATYTCIYHLVPW